MDKGELSDAGQELKAGEILGVVLMDKLDEFLVVFKAIVDRRRSLVVVGFHGLESAREIFAGDLLKEGSDAVHGKCGGGAIVAREDSGGSGEIDLGE